ncbi:leucyl aminopeptidase [Miniphocaeibacter massiliensis]|uniref:leucyl aminopeptidase n=1 Tax=Miniphocaeibacter massiliensis TaxID=2041841 RepID=UPI000C1C222B|nr:leucyl aminopeptidase [Miniphocaeibacter massiliensis]
MAKKMGMELTKTVYKLLKDMAKVKPGESVLVTQDSIGDVSVGEEIVKVADALGCKAMLAWHSTPKGYGALTMDYLPDPLKACVIETDVWIELNDQWLLYSPIWDKAVTNGRTRQIMLGGLGIERIYRNIGAVDIKIQEEFQTLLTNLTKEAKNMRITNEAGTDISFENDPSRPINSEIDYSKPGAHFLLGQIGWAPKEETINGKIVVDGALSGGGDLDLGVLSESITYIVEKGRIVEFKGGKLAKKVKEYFESLDDPNMYLAAHVCYGCSPNAKLEGCTTEDERVWGSTEWGFGHQGPNYTGGEPRIAKSHVDGISLECSVWLDDVQILDKGKFIHTELKELAKKLGK